MRHYIPEGNSKALPAIRSLLFVPGDRFSWCEKAVSAGADAIVFDLEDAIAEDKKDMARTSLVENLMSQLPDIPSFVRVNSMESARFYDDVSAVAKTGITGIMVPKMSSPDDMVVIDRILGWCEPAGVRLCVVPVLETALAIRLAFDIARATDRVAYMGGISTEGGDVQRSLGYSWSSDGEESFVLRSSALIDARAAGVQNPLAGLWTRVEDLAGLRQFAEQNRKLGYEGMVAIHPSHVSIINEIFSPSEEDLKNAERLVAAYEDAVESGQGAIQFDGMMVDEAMAETARCQLRRYGWPESR